MPSFVCTYVLTYIHSVIVSFPLFISLFHLFAFSSPSPRLLFTYSSPSLHLLFAFSLPSLHLLYAGAWGLSAWFLVSTTNRSCRRPRIPTPLCSQIWIPSTYSCPTCLGCLLCHHQMSTYEWRAGHSYF